MGEWRPEGELALPQVTPACLVNGSRRRSLSLTYTARSSPHATQFAKLWGWGRALRKAQFRSPATELTELGHRWGRLVTLQCNVQLRASIGQNTARSRALSNPRLA